MSQLQPEKKQKTGTSRDYDFIVLGAGSAGLAASKAAKAANKSLKVAVVDLVTPSPAGTKWDLGGTCVNVGCIPKKLMHSAGLFKNTSEYARNLGWTVEHKHDWKSMVDKVNAYIKNTNWSYKGLLKHDGVDYLNAFGRFEDANTMVLTDAKGKETTKTFDTALISVGGRPRIPTEVKGWELGITSDDIFWQKKDPGKTLVYGAGYVALECAGFLRELGNDVSVLVRSIPLREFDRQAASQVCELMERNGVRFLPGKLTELQRKSAGGRITATFVDSEGKSSSDEFDTILHAVGRDAAVKDIGLDKLGVKFVNGKLVVDGDDRTNVPNLYALGDCAHKRLELTPVAIKAGELLAARLYGGATTKLDDLFVPTTVFTPVEYGAIGLSHEAAEAKYGASNVETFVSRYAALESGTTDPDTIPATRSSMFTGKNLWARMHALERKRDWLDYAPGDYEGDEREKLYFRQTCLAKLVTVKNLNGKKNAVVGLHYVGPNAGEITQGFALALKFNATKADFDALVGIHPTTAEEFSMLTLTLDSPEGFVKTRGCCG